MDKLLSKDAANGYYVIGTDFYKTHCNMPTRSPEKRTIQVFYSHDPLAKAAKLAETKPAETTAPAETPAPAETQAPAPAETQAPGPAPTTAPTQAETKAPETAAPTQAGPGGPSGDNGGNIAVGPGA